MTLKEQLSNDLKEAMRAGETLRRETIRMAIAAVHNAEIQAGHELDDPGVQDVLAKQVKQRHESAEAFRAGKRQDLVDKEEAEAVILQAYLPQQLSRDEIAAEARKVIDETGAKGPADKGKVMPVIIGRLKGKAEGRTINEVVSELLAQA